MQHSLRWEKFSIPLKVDPFPSTDCRCGTLKTSLLCTCACRTLLESTLLESMQTAVDEDSLSTAQKKKKAIEIDHGPVQPSFGCRISGDATSSPAETVITILVCVDLLCSKRDFDFGQIVA